MMRIVLGTPGQIVPEKGRLFCEERESRRKEFVKPAETALSSWYFICVAGSACLERDVMRLLTAAVVAVVSIVTVPAPASAQTSLDGFGSVQMDNPAALGSSGFPVDFGGRVSFDVMPAVQVFGEFGRVGNVMPTLIETGLAFTRLNLTASAFYGEGGVRLLAAPHSAVSPYVEGTAGVANLQLRRVWLDDRCPHSRGVNLVDTREPLYGIGGGVLLQSGPLRFDLGYRYSVRAGE